MQPDIRVQAKYPAFRSFEKSVAPILAPDSRALDKRTATKRIPNLFKQPFGFWELAPSPNWKVTSCSASTPFTMRSLRSLSELRYCWDPRFVLKAGMPSEMRSSWQNLERQPVTCLLGSKLPSLMSIPWLPAVSPAAVQGDFIDFQF